MLTKLFNTRCSGKCSFFFAHIIMEEKFGTKIKCRENLGRTTLASISQRIFFSRPEKKPAGWKQEYCSIVLHILEVYLHQKYSFGQKHLLLVPREHRNLWVNARAELLSCVYMSGSLCRFQSIIFEEFDGRFENTFHNNTLFQKS